MPTQNDIPVAQRLNDPQRSPQKQTAAHKSIASSLKSVPLWAYGLAILAFLSPIVSTRIWLSLNASAINSPAPSAEPNTSTSNISTPNISGADNLDPQSQVTSIPFVTTSPTTPNQNAVNPDPASSASAPPTLFGHFAFEEAPVKELRTISRASDGYEIRLRQAAADSYRQMEADARADGIEFAVISGFRSISEQQELFFEISKQRNQTPAQRAKVSAPPGHSEHHTGYAIDLGDATVPSTNLSPNFEKTPAFRWLQNNAARYGFEMSFPPNNPQGVMYEPWHWRFVGDDKSLATFYKQQSNSQNNSNGNADNSFLTRP